MKCLNWLLLTAVLASVPARGAPLFVYPRSSCVVLDSGHGGSYPLWFGFPGVGGEDGFGQFPAYIQFGYTNLETSAVTIPQGSNNFFVQSPQGRTQPSTFSSGNFQNSFGTIFDPQVGLDWFLNNAYAPADVSLPPCPGMSVTGAPLPPQFAPVGLASGQTLRLTAFPNRVALGYLGWGSCSGTLSFADALGNPIGPAATNVNFVYPQSAHIELAGSSVTTPGHRIMVQPQFTSGDYTSCQANVEVYATATGVTAATNRPIQPAYQYTFDQQSISAGQTLRLYVAASASWSCGAAVKFVDSSGNQLGSSGNTLSATLPAGTAQYVDLPATSVGLTGWTGGHVPVRPVLNTGATVNGSQIGYVKNNLLVDETCFASAEVFDTLTGYTRSIVNPQPIK